MADDTKVEISQAEQEQLVRWELQAAAVARHMRQTYGEIPSNILVAALNLIHAAVLVDKDNYISPGEMTDKRILTEDENLQLLVDDIKVRAAQMRQLKADWAAAHPQANRRVS